jgi:hypothetical protein
MVATRLKYILQPGMNYLDVSRDLSEYHRKLHRQKKIYTIYGGFMRNNQGTSAKFNVAPLTWTSKAAVNRGFKLWRRMVSETLQNNDGLKSGKWNDFKVRLTGQVAVANHISAVDAAGNPMSAGEWNYSTISQPRLIDPDGDGGLEFDANMDQYDLHIVGANTQSSATNLTSVGLINSWYQSRPVIDGSGSPTQVPDINEPLANLFIVEDDDSEKVTIIQDEGDQPPYNRDAPYGMVGTAASQEGLAPVAIADNDATGARTQALGSQIVGFQALCGLVQVFVTSDGGTTEIFLDVESEGESF